jgi:NADPH:quinone reductase-like Zn-dependent oxidoreductase
MRAVRYHHYGGPDVLKLETVPVPEPKEGEVLIRVHAAGVNPVDWKQRRGTTAPLPNTPGIDLSGTVEALGPGVTGFKVGDAVFGVGRGSYAEYAIASAIDVVPKPAKMTFEEAATIGVGARTAWAALFDSAQIKSGQQLLVQGAAGGVGMWGVQFGRWKGANVTGTASTGNVEFVKSLGAQTVVDYTKTKVENTVKGMDVVLDTVGGEVQDRSWPTLKKGGLLVTIVGSPNEEKAKQHSVRAARVGRPTNSAEIFRTVAQLVESGKAKTAVQKVFPLDQARQAQELCETGHGRGRIILKIV